MRKTDITDKIVDKLITKVKKKFDYTLTPAEVNTILDSQFSIIPEVMKDEGIIKLDGFGMFLIKPGRKELVERNRLSKEDSE